MKEEIFEKFKGATGLNKYNYSLKYRSKVVDVPRIERALYDHLVKQPNVSFVCDSEVTMVEKSLTEKGNVSCVRSGYGGKSSGSYECDALVLCDGWNCSQTLYQHLSYSIPVLPIKQYSVTFDSNAPNTNTSLYVENRGIIAT